MIYILIYSLSYIDYFLSNIDNSYLLIFILFNSDIHNVSSKIGLVFLEFISILIFLLTIILIFKINELNLKNIYYINFTDNIYNDLKYYIEEIHYDCTIIVNILNNYFEYEVKEVFFNEIVNYIFFNNFTSPLFIFGFFLFFFSTLFNFFTINYLGLYGTFVLNLITILIMWVLFLYSFIDIVFYNNYYYVEISNWMYLNSNYNINFSFFVDYVSISFSFLTSTIALCVYVFTFSYFRYEPLVERLLLFLNSFILSMILLVNSGNLIVMFLGWEMIGMTSFFLINFWSSRIGTLKAAFKAYSFNKFSDLFIFIFIISIFNISYSLDIPTFISSIHNYVTYTINLFNIEISLVDFLAFNLLSAAFIKSAQFGAHIWLPDSMEAPVPASALIHSATLVSAGIYLLLRFSILFQMSISSQIIIMFIGSLTAFYGGWVSAFQSDLKRILAYSTISHCGFLMVSFVSFVSEFTILYLYVHGFFKATVFLSVGNIIRFNRGIQDFRRMGCYYKYLTFDSIICLLCLINLSGLPFTFGFFIKHYLFLGLYCNKFLLIIIWSFLLIAAITGLFYSFRLYYYTFFDIKKAKKIQYISVNRNILFSKFYSNSSIAGNYAIIMLFIISYFISIFLTIKLLNYSLFNDIGSDYEFFINIFNNYLEYSNSILNSRIINNIVIILIISIIFSKWRYTIFYWNGLNNFSLILTYSLFFNFMFNIFF